MTHPMFVLSTDIRGIECEIRVNDVRQYRKRDGVSSRFSGRLNPWMVSGTNTVALVARLAASGESAPETPTPAGGLELGMSIVHGAQGQPTEGAPVLFAFKAEAAQLATLTRAPTTLVQATFAAGPLPWNIPWQNLQQGTVVRSDVLAWVRDYLAILKRRDLQALVAANKLRIAVMSNSLGLSTGALTATLESRLNDVEPDQWKLTPDASIVLTEEGGGRFCRVEAAGGGPVIFVERDGREAGFTFLLARSAGQLWVIA